MDVLKITRPRTLGDLVAFELDNHYNREAGTLRSGVGLIQPRTVLGMQTLGTLSGAIAALGTNTGAPTFSSVTVAAGTPLGEYDVMMEDATHFTVFYPPSDDAAAAELGKGVFGTAFTLGGLGVTITAGTPACIASDAFKITVSAAAGDGKLAAVNASATDGTQNAVGIAAANADSASGDAPIAYLARGPMIVRAEELLWPSGATTPRIAAWTAQLAALNPPILVRTSG
jgi:hypothetical protein